MQGMGPTNAMNCGGNRKIDYCREVTFPYTESTTEQRIFVQWEVHCSIDHKETMRKVALADQFRIHILISNHSSRKYFFFIFLTTQGMGPTNTVNCVRNRKMDC